jgi:pantetheine-phosphate adenylyltransferase
VTVALCPGSFDPPTNGHVDVVERASRHFERVIVAVLRNAGKAPLLDAEERVQLLRDALGHLPSVDVEAYDGLLVDLARQRGAGVIVKGLRGTSDTAYELQMATINASLLSSTDTLFIVSSPQWSFVSSSMVKEVARYGGDVSAFVPAPVARALARHFAAE